MPMNPTTNTAAAAIRSHVLYLEKKLSSLDASSSSLASVSLPSPGDMPPPELALNVRPPTCSNPSRVPPYRNGRMPLPPHAVHGKTLDAHVLLSFVFWTDPAPPHVGHSPWSGPMRISRNPLPMHAGHAIFSVVVSFDLFVTELEPPPLDLLVPLLLLLLLPEPPRPPGLPPPPQAASMMYGYGLSVFPILGALYSIMPVALHSLHGTR